MALLSETKGPPRPVPWAHAEVRDSRCRYFPWNFLQPSIPAFPLVNYSVLMVATKASEGTRALNSLRKQGQN